MLRKHKIRPFTKAAALAACVSHAMRAGDSIDYLAMLARVRRRWNEIHDRTSMIMGPRLAEALVEAELSVFHLGICYREICERGY